MVAKFYPGIPSHAWKSWVLHNLKNIARSIFVSKLQSPDDTFFERDFPYYISDINVRQKIKKHVILTT